ncbi:hypothetical protein Tco_1471768, partial [Tanacetum coccineum]
MKVIKKEPKFLWMFQIEYDLFTCDTPLGMNDDMFTYEVGIPGLSYPPHGIYAEPGIFVNKRLVRLMDVTIEEWLDLMYGDHKIFDRKIKEEVISKWLIQSYKKQFNEYMEIKKQRMTHEVAADMEYDPSDIRGDDVEGFEDGELKNEALMKKTEFEESRDPCSFDVDNEEATKDERKPINDYGVGDSDDHLILNNAPDYANKEEEQYKKRGCDILRNPHEIPPTCKIERFEVIKYSFGPVEEFVAIKEYGYNDWMKTEEDACHVYRDIFAK